MSKIKNINNWEILTPSGWSDFSGIKKTTKSFYYKITFDDGFDLCCSDNHRIKTEDGNFIYANKLKKGNKIQAIDKTFKIVKYKRKINKKIDLYDILDVKMNAEFFTNDIISHNCAFIDNAEEVWTSAQQTMATGGRAILLSTPNGVGNFFHKTWVDAEGKKNKFHCINLKWNRHPERNQEWRDRQTQELGIKKAAQECFDGNTRIYTSNGLIPIKNVKIGDLVLTHTGEFKPVINTFKHTTTDYSEFSSIINTNKSYVTKNHPFYTKNKEWVEFKDLKNKELCNVFPTNITLNNKCEILDLYKNICPNKFKLKTCGNETKIFINDRKYKTIHNRYIEINYKLGYIIGCVLSEGYIQDNDNRLDLSFNWNTELNDWPKKVIEYTKELFGIDSFQLRCQGNSGHLTICSQIVCKTLNFFINGTTCYDKTLSKNSYLYKNVEFFKGIVDGCFVGDGMVLTNYSKRFTTRSKNLMYDVKYILSLLNFGIISQTMYSSQSVNESDCYILNILNSKNIECEDRNVSCLLENNQYRIAYKFSNECGVDDFYYSQLLKNEISNTIPIDVYNLEVLDLHSYVTEHFVVHNCDCEFLSSGNTVVEISLIEEYKKLIVDPVEIRGSDQTFWIWERPDYSKNYIVSADVARGDGNDFSAFQVIDPESLTQVAEYKGIIGTKEYGNMLVAVATEYNNALLVIENATYGWAVIQQVIDRGYDNLFYSSADLQYVDVEQHMTNRLNALEKKMIPGFTNSTKTRPLVIGKLETCMREKVVTIRSVRLLDELCTFIWNNGKAEAMRNYNDDLVISMSIGLWIRDTALRLRAQSMDVNRVILSGIKRTGVSDVMKNEERNIKNKEMALKSWQFDTMGGIRNKKESLNWLL